MRLAVVIATVALGLPITLVGNPPSGQLEQDTVPAALAAPAVIASKPFGESSLLMEMFAQLLEERGYRVERRPWLGATEIAFQALRTGAIDIYPEYTGTGLLAILHQEPMTDPQAVYDEVTRKFSEQFDVRWLPPLGFENTYAIAVRRSTADSLALVSLSDLAERGRSFRAGFTADFLGRPDGLPGLRQAYGLSLAEVRPLLPAVKYQALDAGQVDVIDGYSTDGFIERYDLVVLQDDRGFFPPYQAAALVNGAFARERPEVVSVLTELSGRISEPMMRRWNRRLEDAGDPVVEVARDALRELSLLGLSDAGQPAPAEGRSSLSDYLWGQRGDIARNAGRHLFLVITSLAAGIMVALPLGLVLERRRALAEPVIRAVGLMQTVPSIALLAFMIPLLGIGVVPALVALFLYALFPIVRNTFTGVREADAAAVGAATALGMTPGQVLRYIRLPLAAPVIMAGIRTAAVITVGTATLAAFIGAGGLGEPIVAGLALSDTRLIMSGALPAAVLALLVDAILAGVERLVRPGGVTEG